jgi:HSP20 family protein
MKQRRSFFERLTGAVRVDDDFEHDNFEDTDTEMGDPLAERRHHVHAAEDTHKHAGSKWMEEAATEGELTVDVYQTANEIVIRTMVAGVRPEDIDISATRDTITVKGKRESEKDVQEEDFFHRELYWGAFSRTIVLPAEVEPEEAEVTERHGLLIIRLPKINKGKQTKLKVKSY